MSKDISPVQTLGAAMDAVHQYNLTVEQAIRQAAEWLDHRSRRRVEREALDMYHRWHASVRADQQFDKWRNADLERLDAAASYAQHQELCSTPYGPRLGHNCDVPTSHH